MGIAIWLVPSGQDALKLESIMRPRTGKSDKLSSSSYPKFDPHITITSIPTSNNIPLSAIRAAIPISQGPVPAEFESIKIEDHFFRSVYLAVEPQATLLAFHEHIHTTLGIEPRAGLSFPHLSLCYIDEEDTRNGERDRFLRELEDNGRVLREDGRVGVKGLGDHGEPEQGWLWGFEASEAWIVDCDGPVSGWSVLAKIPLTKSA